MSRPLRFEPLERRCLLSLATTGTDVLAHLAGSGDQTTFSQCRAPGVAIAADGHFVVVWADSAADGSGYGVYTQRFDAAGTAQSDPVRVNDTVLSQQTFPSVAMDADGDFVVSWSSLLQDGSLYGVYARCYTAAGAPLTTEFRVNQHTTDNQNFSAVAMDADGDFVVAWTSQAQDGDRAGIYARRYNAAGLPLDNEFRVNTTIADNQRWPNLAMDSIGNFVVTWTSQAQDGSGGGIYAQRYYVDGTPLGTEFRVNTTTAGNQQYSSVALGLDSTVLVWQSYNAANSTWKVCSRRYDLDGQPLGDEVVLGQGRHASVTQAPGGDYVVAWETYDPKQIEPTTIYVQHFDPLGWADGEPIHVSNVLGSDQFGPTMAATDDQLVVLWTNDTTTTLQGLNVRAVQMTVTPSLGRNHPPSVAPLADCQIDEEQTLALTATATDPDDPDAVLTYSLAPGSPAGAAIDPATGQFTWTPSEAQGPGTFVVTVRATDDAPTPLTGATTFRVTVREVNAAPVIDPIDDQSVNEGQTLTLTIPAHDPDLPSNTLTYLLESGSPAGAVFDPATGQFTWTPDEAQGPGTYTIHFTVTDSGTPALDAAGSFVVNVFEVNQPPVIEPIDDQTIDLGQTLVVTAVASDPDLPPAELTFSLIDAPPAGAAIDPTTGQLTWTPAPEQGAGTYSITVQVSDGALTSATTFIVTVETPILEPIADQTIDEEQTLEVPLVATPPYDLGSGVTLALSDGAPAGMTIDPAGLVVRWTPDESQGPGTYTVIVVATETGNPAARDTESFTVTVAEVNRPPEIAPLENQTIDELVPLSIQVVVTDPDIPPNSLAFSLDAAPAGAAINATTGLLTWTPAEDQNSPTPYEVTVRVADNGEPSLASTATFWITVNEVNAPPAIDPIAHQTIDLGETLSLVVTATDPDVPANGLVFSLDDGAPAGAAIDPATGQFTWTAADPPLGDYPVVVRVTDDGNPPLSATASFTITVETPLIDRPADVELDEGGTVAFTVPLTAPWTLAELVLGMTGLPAGAAFDPATGQFTWTTTEADGPGQYTLVLHAQTNETTPRVDTETFTIRVREVNEPPEIAPATLADQIVTAGESIQLDFNATDPDVPANTLVFSLGEGAPTGATIDPATGVLAWQTSADQAGTYSITVRVTDDGQPTLADEVTFSILVANPNQAPVADPVEDQTVPEGQTLALTVTAADPDDPPNGFTFSLAEGSPAGATIDPTTGQFTWTPGEADGPGDHEITVLVTDDAAAPAQGSVTFTVTVTEVNEPPTIEPIDDATIAAGQALALPVTATDPDVPTNGLTFSLEPGGPAGLAIDPVSGLLTWDVPLLQTLGPYVVTVHVVDDGQPSLGDSRSFTIHVVEPNFAPVIDPIEDRIVAEETLLELTVTATDPNSPPDAITFSLDPGSPAGATIDPVTGQFTWTPTEEQGPGDYTITIRATDNGSPVLDDAVTFTVTVSEVNRPPVLAPVENQTVVESQMLVVQAEATDPDLPAEGLSYSLDLGAPAGATIDPTTGLFTWTPSESQGPGQYVVTIRATDDGQPALDDAVTFTVTVTEMNHAPALAPIADQTLLEGQTLDLIVSATDPDVPTNAITFRLDPGAPTGATIDPATGRLTWTTTDADGPGTYTITVRATDDGSPNLSATVSFQVQVNESNQAPVLESIADRTVNEGQTVALTAVATDPDLPGNAITFSLDPGAPAGATINPTTGQFTWTPSESQGPGVYTITIRATDDGSPAMSATTTFLVNVAEVNAPPVLEFIADQTLLEGQTLDLVPSVFDPDVPADGLTFSLDAGPSGATIDPATGRVLWTTAEGDAPRAETFTIRVTDGGTPPLSDVVSFQVTVVAVNQTPWTSFMLPSFATEHVPFSRVIPWSDADWPTHPIVFSIESGGPAGATIDSTGRFQWTPGEEHGGTTQQFTIRMSDGAMPEHVAYVVLEVRVNEHNGPPALAPISNRSVPQGQTLVVQPTATDTDVPAGALRYALGPGAPEGLSVDRLSGQITWTVGPEQAPGDYPVTLKVSDNGYPIGSATQSFVVTVVASQAVQTLHVSAPPVLPAISREESTPLWEATPVAESTVARAPEPCVNVAGASANSSETDQPKVVGCVLACTTSGGPTAAPQPSWEATPVAESVVVVGCVLARTTSGSASEKCASESRPLPRLALDDVFCILAYEATTVGPVRRPLGRPAAVGVDWLLGGAWRL